MDQDPVGRYKLLRRLAAGGMGEVHLAAQAGPQGFEKVVALKRLLPTMASEVELVRLFLDEARLVAQLSHRNICQIFDLGEDGDGYFVAMEFVQGPSVRTMLDKLLANGEQLPPALAVDIAAAVCDALAYAFSAPGRDGQPLRIIHRDVSPHNVLISVSGDVKLIDFGVAKSADQSHSTQAGTIKGKFAYMSPEQSRGRELDARSDLFCVGIMLYEMVSGKNPFHSLDIVQTVMAIQSEDVPPLADLDPVLAPLDEVLERLLAKNPDDRFPDANMACEELAAIRSELPRPPTRLGPFVSERFGAEAAAIIRSVSDSSIRLQLQQQAGVSPRTPSKPARAISFSDINPSASSGPLEPLDPGATYIRPVAAVDSTRIATPVASGSSAGPWLLFLAVIALGGGAGAWYFLAGSASGPAPVLAAVPEAPAALAPKVPEPAPAAALAPAPAAPVPAPAPPVVAAVQVPAPAPVTPPSAPAVVAPAPPAVAVAVEPPARADKPSRRHRDQAQNRGADPKNLSDALAEVAPAPAPEAAPAPAPEPAATLGTATLVGPGGRSRVDLHAASGHVALGQAGSFNVGLDFNVGRAAVIAKLTCDPWAIVSIDGETRGKTPVPLPPLGSAPVQVELRRPNADPVQVVISADLKH